MKVKEFKVLLAGVPDDASLSFCIDKYGDEGFLLVASAQLIQHVQYDLVEGKNLDESHLEIRVKA